MKKLKSFFLKLKSKRTIKTYQKPLLITITTLIIINLVIIIIASIVGVIIDPDYFQNNVLHALAHFFSCMLTANTITKLLDIINDHLEVFLLSVVVIAIELVLFSGAIIATLTTAVRNFIDKKSNAKGKIELDNQFVILNYNSKVPDIIYNLMQKHYKNSVIILSNKSKDYINGEIDSLISSFNNTKDKKRKLNLIIKEGNPLLHGDLEDISISKASSILVMSREDMKEGDDENITNNDLMTLKVMLALGNYDIKKDCNIVIETDSDAIKEKIENLALTLNNLKNKSIIPVSFNRKIGQIIAQTMVEPMMASIYLELLSYEGSEFYSYADEEIDDYLVSHNNAIPIIKYGNLFVLAEDEADIKIKRNNVSDLTKARILKTKSVDLSIDCTIFVIGDNKKGKFIRENLQYATEGYGANFKVFNYEKNETDKLIEDIKKTSGIKKVLILSDDTVDNDSYDANVFVTLIALQTAFKHRDRHELSFITELLDSKNLNSINDFNIKNAIISNRMMSLLLSQLSLNKESKKFFEGLLTIDSKEGGDYFDIKIEEVKDMLDDSEVLSFKNRSELIQSFYLSFDKKYMLIGYVQDEEVVFIAKDQDVDKEINLKPDDSFIFIKY